MALHLQDRWLWAGIGAVLLTTLSGIRWYSHAVQFAESDTTDQSHAEHSSPQAQPEDGIELHVLEALLSNPSYHIRTAAERILLSRFQDDDACVDSMIRETWNGDEDQREKARKAVHNVMAASRALDIPDSERLYSSFARAVSAGARGDPSPVPADSTDVS